MAVIDIDLAQAIIDEMAGSLQDLVTQALQKQATEFAQRTRHDGEEESKGEDQVQINHMEMALKNEVEKLEAEILQMRENHQVDVKKEKTRLEEERDAHKADMDKLKRQLTDMDKLNAELKKLMEMLAPLEVWARIILPNASSAANKNAVNREAAWKIDGKHSICTTGSAANNAVTKKNRGSNPSSSFKYDRVFDPTSTNSDVYSALSVYVKHGIESKHLMLIMYGRSGTGKSQTLIKTYRQELASGEKRTHPPLIQNILRSAFALARARSDAHAVSARITCLEYRTSHFYDLAAEKPQRWAKADAMTFMPAQGVFKISSKPGVHEPTVATFTSADDAVSHIQASDKRRGESKTDENDTSSRGHAWYEVRMCSSSSRTKGDDDGQQEHKIQEEEEEDADLGVYTFFDLGGLEQLQTGSGSNQKPEQKHGAKKESNSLTMALEALKTPFRAIAARETDWDAPDGNIFVQAITNQLKGTGPYDKFGRPQIIILGQVNGYQESKDESRDVLETLHSWRTLR